MARVVIQLAAALIVAYIAIQFLPQFGDTKPDPKPPGPVDPVDPKPSPDEPDFSGYADKVYDRIMKVKSRNRKAECEQLSGDVQKIIDRIDSGALADNQSIVNELATALRKLPMVWYPQIRKIADDVLQPLTKDGSLSTPARWGKLLRVAKAGVDRAGRESVGVDFEDDGVDGK